MHNGMIGINGTILGRRPTGLGVYAKNMIEELDRQGVKFILYTSFAEGLELSDENRRRVHLTSFSMEPTAKWRHLRRHLWIQFFLPRLLKKDGISLLLNLVPEAPFFSRSRQVTMVHDLMPLNFPGKYFLQKLNFRAKVPVILKRSKRVVANSDATKNDVIRFYGIESMNIHAIPIAFDARRFKPTSPDNVKERFGLGRYFLYVGNMLPHKNLPMLIESFGIAFPGPGHMLVIAGYKDPRYFPRILDHAKKNRVEDKVLFLDYVPDHDLPPLMSGADALILPSVCEGFGLTPLEAMACGCPVAVSDLASIREVCGDSALYFNPKDPKGLADILKKIAEDENLRAALRGKGLERSKNFSWNRCAAGLLEILKNV